MESATEMQYKAAVAESELEPASTTVLLVTATHWPFTTRLCLAMADSGLDVRAVAPKHHALHQISSIATECLGHSRRRALADISMAIERHTPKLIVPGDELAIEWLRILYARSIRGLGRNPSYVGRLIETSVGSPSAFAPESQKSGLIALARQEGVLVPATEAVRNIEHLRKLIADARFPLVLKRDDSFGGQGVRIVENRQQAERAFSELRFAGGPMGALKQVIKRLDVAPLERLWRRAPTIALQAHVDGRPANRAIVCTRGTVLAGLSVEVAQTLHASGPSSVVQIIDSPQMTMAVARLTRRLGLSGFVGFDFMLEGSGDRPYLIEMNMRPTPICHLAFDSETDLIGALATSVTGTRRRRAMLSRSTRTIALFPQESWRNPQSSHLQSAYHDVPWQSPEFLAAYRSRITPDPNWLNTILEQGRQIIQRFHHRTAPATGTLAGDQPQSLHRCRPDHL